MKPERQQNSYGDGIFDLAAPPGESLQGYMNTLCQGHAITPASAPTPSAPSAVPLRPAGRVAFAKRRVVFTEQTLVPHGDNDSSDCVFSEWSRACSPLGEPYIRYFEYFDPLEQGELCEDF
jgi:hypothetical protein